MKITSGAFLITLLLSIASTGIACGSRAINKQEAKATSRQAGGADDSSVPAGWKRYDFEKPIAFNLSLPSEPEQRVSTIPDQTETSQVFISASSSGVYGAIYISDLPGVARNWTSAGNKMFYEIFLDDFVVKIAGKSGEQNIDFYSKLKFTAERTLMVSGLEGLERDFSVGDFQGRLQLVRVGPAGFCLVAIWKQAAPPAERDDFFKSAKIVSDGS